MPFRLLGLTALYLWFAVSRGMLPGSLKPSPPQSTGFVLSSLSALPEDVFLVPPPAHSLSRPSANRSSFGINCDYFPPFNGPFLARQGCSSSLSSPPHVPIGLPDSKKRLRQMNFPLNATRHASLLSLASSLHSFPISQARSPLTSSLIFEDSFPRVLIFPTALQTCMMRICRCPAPIPA